MKKNVDIILPIHGESPYLDVTIKSIFENRDVPTRLVIIEDRNLNPQLHSLIELPPENFEVLILQSDKPGIVAALNLGISNSNSEFIARMDADDVMDPKRISIQIDYLNSNPNVVCVGSQLELINEEGIAIGHTNYPILNSQILKRLEYQNCLAHPSVMFRRSILETSSPYRAHFAGAEDYDLWTRLSEHGEIHNIDMKLVKYRYSIFQYSNVVKTKQGLLEDCVRISWANRKWNNGETIDEPRSGEISDLEEFYKSNLAKIKTSDYGKYRRVRSAESLNQLLRLRGQKKETLKYLSDILIVLVSSAFQSPALTAQFLIGHFKYHSIKFR